MCLSYALNKLCRELIVVMKKLKITKTNETRMIIANVMYVKCRADKLEVIMIININD